MGFFTNTSRPRTHFLSSLRPEQFATSADVHGAPYATTYAVVYAVYAATFAHVQAAVIVKNVGEVEEEGDEQLTSSFLYLRCRLMFIAHARTFATNFMNKLVMLRISFH